MVAVMERNLTHKFDFAEAVKLRLEGGLSYDQLAERYGMSKSGIYAKLKPLRDFLEDPTADRQYQDNRIGILTTLERALVTQMFDADRLKKATVNNIAYAFQQVHTARRLEMDLSTANVSSRVQVRDMQPEEKERLDKALEAMYSPTPANAKVEGDGHGAP